MTSIILRVFINRNFGLLWAGQAISSLGDRVFDTTLILWVATRIASGHRWAPLAVSGVLLSVAIPTIVLGPIAGVFVDRWDKRRTMLVMDVLRAGLIVVLLLNSRHTQIGVQLASVYVIVSLASACTNFFGPARLVVLRDIVPEADLTRAAGRQQTTNMLSTIVGPAIAAPLFIALGVQWALVVNAASFLVSFALISLVRLPSVEHVSAARESVRGELGAGLRYFASNRVLMVLIMSVVLVFLGFGAFTALNVFFLMENLHAPVRLYGLLTASTGAGAVLGTLASTALARRIRPLQALWLSLMTMGILDLAYARMSSLIPAVIVLFLTGLPAALYHIVLNPIVLQVTPREFVGRVAAILSPAFSLASLCSVALAGFLTSTVLHGFHAAIVGITFGPIDTLFSATGVLEILAAIVALLSLRGVKLLETEASLPARSA
jgi:MFS family permease